MSINPVSQLDVYGPDRCDELSLEEAQAWCRRLALGRYENFSVLSAVVPKPLRTDLAAVYAFCRWADDLGDEIPERERALELLGWWRRELEQCYNGAPRHPVFIALAPTIERHGLPMQLFDDLIRAFEQDQHLTRCESWKQVLEYCRLSANPVGRLVLMMLSKNRDEEAFACSDAICTALQLTNHWQDIGRDILERDRIYVPTELIRIERFEERLIASARQGYAVDQTFLEESRVLVRGLVEKTWPLYERGQRLFSLIDPSAAGVAWLLASGGQRVLRLIEMWNYETVLHRPKLSRMTRARLLVEAGLRVKLRRFGREQAA